MLVLTLPEPPSTNRLFGVSKTGQRYPSRAYKAWIKEAGWQIRIQRVKAVTGPYEVQIEISSISGLDADNAVKALADALVKMKITDDDRHCKSVTVSKVDTVERGQCRVVVWPWMQM